MQQPPSQISTCPTCGSPIDTTSAGDLGCIACLIATGLDAEPEQPNTPSASTPDQLGAYTIEHHVDGSVWELGHGAMGVTYRAFDKALDRRVALKIINIDRASHSTEARERFMREARAAAALRHPNVATVYQFGVREETGQFFYAMEIVEGETLEERVCRTGPLSARTTIDIAQQVTSALAAAEKHSLIHRDLKPANLMLVSPDDEEAGTAERSVPIVKIIDFGLAKVLNAPVDAMHLTHDGFVGTPAFASPEQFENTALDVRSDIYSLGATLWFALTGKTPFSGQGFKEIRGAQQSHALRIEQLKATRVPSRLKSLLKSMLAFEPAARPGTHELTAELRRCAAEARGERRARVGLAAAAILILGVSAFSIFWPLSKGHRPVAVTERSPLNLPVPKKSIAVLPFENLSEDPANSYFAGGIQEEILTRLSSVADLRVISRTSTERYQGQRRNLAEIAKELGVANILEGSVQKAADQVRVNVQLINAQTDSHLWADTYDRKLTDIFGVESEIAKRIAESLQAKLTGREEQALAVKPTNNSEAYDAYLRGLAFEARSRFSLVSIDLVWKAVGFYEQAVQLDRNFALAWARLSRADSLLYFNGEDTNPPTRRDEAKRALENAQKVQPDSPETLLALGYFQYWVLRDYGPAKTTFERISKLLPGSSEAPKALGYVARRQGNWDQSITYFQQALAVDPRNVELLVDTASTYVFRRQFQKALKLYDRVLDITPNDPDVMAAKASVYQAEGKLKEAARFLSEINWQTPSEDTLAIKVGQLRLERNYGEAVRLLQIRQAQFHFSSERVKGREEVVLAFTQRLAGDVVGAKASAEQAVNTLEQLRRNQPDNAFVAAPLSQAYAAIGKKESALNEAERAITLLPTARDPVSGPGLEENLAFIQMISGENSRAIAALTQLLQTPYDNSFFAPPMVVTTALLKLDPLWDPLRADPAFQKLCDEKEN